MENNSCESNNQIIATHYALRVALQTMKERCLCQQKRLAEMEEENQCLRHRLATNKQTNKKFLNNGSGMTENYQLRLQINELQLQKEQLNTHINMVSNENRKLWSRLSQITKCHSKTKSTSPLFKELSSSENTLELTVHQNLIRSKTFTQHSPNPKLRHKLLATSNEKVDYLHIDATEDELDFLRSGLEEKSEYDMADNNFGYLHENDFMNNTDNVQDYSFSAEAKKCIERLHEMRQEMVKQQQDLKFLVTFLKNRNINKPPVDYMFGKEEKSELSDKILESNINSDDNCIDRKRNKGVLDAFIDDNFDKNKENAMNFEGSLLQSKDGNKICPMCGTVFDSQIPFELFCEHVEEHFCDDSIGLDHSAEQNFEIVSATMSNF